jgi:hypothetical protein
MSTYCRAMSRCAALAAMTVGLLACSGERKETPPAPPQAALAARDAGGEATAGVHPEAAAAGLRQEPIDVDAFERPPETGQDGVVAGGIRFIDQNGANLVVLIHQVEEGGGVNNRRLWVHHYVEVGGKLRLLRTVRDQEENCELDNVARFVDGSLAVTDLDGDGLGEVAFAYDLGCMSDVSPKGRKVVLLENREKWILRGQSRVDAGDGPPMGGRFTPDPPQPKWPKTLHDHAIDVWDRFVDR